MKLLLATLSIAIALMAKHQTLAQHSIPSDLPAIATTGCGPSTPQNCTDWTPAQWQEFMGWLTTKVDTTNGVANGLTGNISGASATATGGATNTLAYWVSQIGTTIGGTGSSIGNAALGPIVNWNSSGFPGINLSNRFLMSRATTGPTDTYDMQFVRNTTFSGGSGSNINSMLAVLGTFGANDATAEWPLLTIADCYQNTGGSCVAHFVQTIKESGSTGFFGGMTVDFLDKTGLASSLTGNGQSDLEADFETNGADDASNSAMFGGHGNRLALQIMAVRRDPTNTAQTQVSHGIWFGTQTNPNAGADSHTNFMSAMGFATNTQAYNVLDTRGAVAPTGSSNPVIGVNLSAGQVIDFKGGASLNSAPQRYLEYVSGDSALEYFNAGTKKFSISDVGNVNETSATVAKDLPNTGATQANMSITTTAVGSGTNGPATAQNALSISLIKDGFPSGGAVGELDPLQIFGRQSGTGSDMSGILVNVQDTGLGFLSATEFAVSIYNTGSNSITQQMDTQDGVLNALTGDYDGAVRTAVTGNLGYGYLVQSANGSATWQYAFAAMNPSNVQTFSVDPAGNVIGVTYRETLTTPASSSAACTAGQFTDDANYHYVCTATNTWKRAALSSF